MESLHLPTGPWLGVSPAPFREQARTFGSFEPYSSSGGPANLSAIGSERKNRQSPEQDSMQGRRPSSWQDEIDKSKPRKVSITGPLEPFDLSSSPAAKTSRASSFPQSSAALGARQGAARLATTLSPITSPPASSPFLSAASPTTPRANAPFAGSGRGRSFAAQNPPTSSSSSSGWNVSSSTAAGLSSSMANLQLRPSTQPSSSAGIGPGPLTHQNSFGSQTQRRGSGHGSPSFARSALHGHDSSERRHEESMAFAPNTIFDPKYQAHPASAPAAAATTQEQETRLPSSYQTPQTYAYGAQVQGGAAHPDPPPQAAARSGSNGPWHASHSSAGGPVSSGIRASKAPAFHPDAPSFQPFEQTSNSPSYLQSLRGQQHSPEASARSYKTTAPSQSSIDLQPSLTSAHPRDNASHYAQSVASDHPPMDVNLRQIYSLPTPPPTSPELRQIEDEKNTLRTVKSETSWAPDYFAAQAPANRSGEAQQQERARQRRRRLQSLPVPVTAEIVAAEGINRYELHVLKERDKVRMRYPDSTYPFLGDDIEFDLRKYPTQHAVAAMQSEPTLSKLYVVVTFKFNRAGVYVLPPESQFTDGVVPGDCVQVDHDRGFDIGFVHFTSPRLHESENMCRSINEHHQWSLLNSSLLYRELAEAHKQMKSSYTMPSEEPKIQHKIADWQKLNFFMKEKMETKAKRVVEQAIKKFGMPIEVLDVEIHADFQKLTVNYISPHYVEFQEVVQEVYKSFKMRIWMNCIIPNKPSRRHV